jgi:hypothetical protein
MGEHTRRVVAGFDDPHQADEARRRLAAEHPDERVDENAPGDIEVERTRRGDRGDSVEQQPEITLAVEAPDDEVDDDAIELADEGADFEVVERPVRS